METRILVIGDIVAHGGREAVKALVPQLRREYGCAFCVANGENMAGGGGITKPLIDEFPAGTVDVFTAGDHTWDQKEFPREIVSLDRMVRPANFSVRHPGKGWGIFRHPGSGEVAVISLVGKVFMRDSAYCPFETVEKIL